ncbi:uncharacterized protein MYCFIDRAFT_34621 [Pseudocercospora fijiensis CIRAD86]|uniref:Choline monooxygenase, chloroplastic n=1 Tax=Pseudocercospora fijiensis (strain CIRAD86) TaxID=383855 RepID=M2ZJX3_PSEFD|nr:uncharacterized protein MYCFIDRAFT_34621 [Pseudocercospora fijiensis CIRAD86]EME79409.1 hypothetical protein MYCFIDRAFT_34621 [Pseudocercospora fijiensis CIRAD86]
MASLMNFFGRGKATTEEPKKNGTVRALPAAWYTSQEMYELERRAIFQRRWLFITHKSRLQQPGDFLRYKIAGYDFVLVVDRNNQINAFHNVCRHRAYKVVEEESGRKNILACRYHGWSYGLNGKLAKAPDYQQIEGFNKDDNSLLPIHTHVDDNGFVWINMDAGEKPEISFEQDVGEQNVKQSRFEKFNFDNYELDHVYELNGDYNWKIASDNFNECYHCKTTHPDVPTFLTIDSHNCEGDNGHLQHDQAPTKEQIEKGFDCNSTYYFPHASMTVSPHFLMIQKFLPGGPSKSVMHYEIYRNKSSSDEDFHAIADTYSRVMGEDKVLCERAQSNLNAGVFVNGELHHRWEKGPLYFQQQCREAITEHFNKEKAAGRELNPAMQKLKEGESNSDLEICASLACNARKEVLAW